MIKYPYSRLAVDLENKIKKAETELLVFVSGGSFVPILAKVLADLSKYNTDHNKVTFALVDERYSADSDSVDSNHHQIARLSLNPQALGIEFKQLLRAGESMGKCAQDYAKWVEEKLADHNIRTLAILGAGKDFHTAGILPHKPEVTEVFYQDLVVAYDADEMTRSDNPYRERITLSFAALSKIDEIWLQLGEGKQFIAETLSQSGIPTKEDVAEKPVLFIKTLHNPTIYVD